MAKLKAERGRFFSRKKMDVALRVLRGDDLDLVSREAGITVATVSAWRDQLVASGQAGLKNRADEGCADELALQKAMVGDLTMRLELSREASGYEVAPLWPTGGRRDESATSPSTIRPYGVVLVCQEWGVYWSMFYHQQVRVAPSHGAPAKRGPKTAYTDEVLTAHVRHVLATSPFPGEGHCKVWARLRAQGIRLSILRVLRLMRKADLLAPSQASRVLGLLVHDGSITRERPNQMWGTDATSTITVEEGSVTVIVAIDHCMLEGVEIDAATWATSFEALEPIHQGVRQQCGVFSAGRATGVQVRHDHGSQCMSEVFQTELRFLGMTSSPAFVRASKGNGGGAVHSDAQGAAAVGVYVPDGRGSPPRPPRLLAAL